MATRYGHQYGKELVDNHGWAWDTAEKPEDWFGDRWVIDPITGTSMSPHDAKTLQAKRDLGLVNEEPSA